MTILNMNSYIVILILIFELANAQTWHYYQGMNYLIVATRMTNAKAKAECSARNASLANIKTTELQHFIDEKIRNLSNSPGLFYIGATRINGTDKFQWTDGTYLNITQWKQGEPDNARGNENCVFMTSNISEWYDFPCSFDLGFICERKSKINVDTTPNLSTLLPTNKLTSTTNLTLPTTNTIQTASSRSHLIILLFVIGFLLFTNLTGLMMIVKLRTQHKNVSPKSSNRLKPNPDKETVYEVPIPAPFHDYGNVQNAGKSTNEEHDA